MAPLVNRNMQPTARNLRDLINFWRDGQINMTPPYQRGDVWTIEQRVALIKSLMLGIPVASLVLNMRDNHDWKANEGDPGAAAYAVIDGKQRLTTVRMFFDGDLAVPVDWFDPRWIRRTVRGVSDVYWGDFEKPAQRYMGQSFIVPVAEARLGSLAEEAEVYSLINSAGTAHTGAELAAARRIAKRV
jgi:hypothetical protein